MAAESVAPSNQELEAADDAHARLCNAECMLQILRDHVFENEGEVNTWRVREVLDGVLRLLDGSYVAIGEVLNFAIREWKIPDADHCGRPSTLPGDEEWVDIPVFGVANATEPTE